MNLPDGMIRALRALYSNDPVTDEDRAEHHSLVAAQRARDEAKREPSPQSDWLHKPLDR